jgi:hypothetical protein
MWLKLEHVRSQRRLFQKQILGEKNRKFRNTHRNYGVHLKFNPVISATQEVEAGESRLVQAKTKTKKGWGLNSSGKVLV